MGSPHLIRRSLDDCIEEFEVHILPSKQRNLVVTGAAFITACVVRKHCLDTQRSAKLFQPRLPATTSICTCP